jgi:hypothetical protein
MVPDGIGQDLVEHKVRVAMELIRNLVLLDKVETEIAGRPIGAAAAAAAAGMAAAAETMAAAAAAALITPFLKRPM